MPLQHDLMSFEQNPFGLECGLRRRREKQILALSSHRVVADLLDGGHVRKAECAVLAIGFVRAANDQAPLSLRSRLWEALPRSAKQYWRIAMAAGRGYRAIDAIAGPSALSRYVRQQTWAACFGDSLHRILDMEQVIVDHDVLILGETGTGKELVASAIQAAMPGDLDGHVAPSAALNAAAVPETLIESELFGHVKGAFTGASENRRGQIRRAHGGCFFLDEVGDLKETTQVKLLRVMETNHVSPIGADAWVEAACRYVAATHKDLPSMANEGRFRRDFYQRLAGLTIRIPPLRDRPEDIPAIGETLVDHYSPPAEVRERTQAWLQAASTWDHDWPGNVRELQNRLRSVMLGLGESSPRPRPVSVDSLAPPNVMSGDATLREVDQWYLGKVLDKVEDNYAAAARVLGIDRATIRRRARSLDRQKS